MRVAAIAFALAVAGCAGQTRCRPIIVPMAPQIIERTVYVHDYQPPLGLIARYEVIERAERTLLLHSKPAVIRNLDPFDAAAVRAMAPILAPDHHATLEELGRAVVALDALQAYVSKGV